MNRLAEWIQARRAVLWTIVIGAALSAAAFYYLRKAEYRVIDAEFERIVANRASALEREIDSELRKLIALKAYYVGSEKIDRSEFGNYAKIMGCECVQAFGWIPRVLRSEREVFEGMAKHEGFPDFQISEKARQGAMIRALDRDEYYPVCFIEPYQGNEIALGFDLASEPVRKAAMDYARDSGEMTATERITLVQEKEGGYGFLVFMPIYEKGQPADALEERRSNIKGFYLGVYRVAGIVESALQYLQDEHVDIVFYDMSASGESQFLYRHVCHGRTSSLSFSEQRTDADRGLERIHTFDVAGRKWRAKFMASHNFVGEHRSWRPWTALFAGLLATTFFVSYLRLIIGRAREVEMLVDQRTEELQSANKMLENEVRIRQQAELEARGSENRYRAIVQDQEELVCRFLPDKTLTFVNEAYCRFFNKKPEDLLGKTFLPFICEEDLDTVHQGLASLKISAPSSNHENRVILADGSIVWMSWTDRALFDDRGNLVEYQAVGRDVTDRKRMELVLRKAREELERRVEERTADLIKINEDLRTETAERIQSEELLRREKDFSESIIDTAQVIILVLDAKGRIVRINPYMEALSGYRLDEIQGKDWFSTFLPEEERDEIRKLFANAISDSPTKGNINRIIARDGRELFVEWYDRILKGADGSFQGLLAVGQDVTERKAAEEIREEQFDFLQNLINTIPSPVFFKDEKGVYRACNSAFEKYLGLSRENIIGKTVYDVVQKDLADHLSEMDKDLYWQTGVQVYETQVRYADGTMHDVIIYKTVYRKADGTVAGLVGVMNDITDRKRAEESLKASELRLSQIIDFLPDATFAVDAAGKVIAWNRAIAEMSGVGAEKMLGRGNYEYALPFYGERRPILIDLVFNLDPTYEGKYSEFRRDGDTLFAETQILDLRGKSVWLWGKAAPICDDFGNRIGAIESMRDVTEVKEIEKALREGRAGLKNIVEKSIDGIFIVDEQGIVRFVNPSGERLFGRSSEEFVGRPFGFPLVAGAPAEIDILRKDGKLCIGELRSAPIQWEDRPAYLAMVRDVTERKKAEQHIKASLHEKETMLKEIHHRVKNNMQVVSSLLRLQSRAVEDKKLKEIYRESENRIRSMALVHEKLYRSENLSRVDFKSYVVALIRELFRSYDVSEERVGFKTDVEGVQLAIEQAVPCGLVISELVSNCLKHAFPGEKTGAVQVLLCSTDDGQVELIVQDNGVGMPQGFDFAKTESLGLYLVRMLAEYQLNGTVSFSGKQGSKFCVTFKGK